MPASFQSTMPKIPTIPTHEAVLTVKVTPAQKAEIEAAAGKLIQRPGVWARDVLCAAAAQVNGSAKPKRRKTR
jgi:hypothetical protein